MAGEAIAKRRTTTAPVRSVTVVRQPKRHGPFIIDSDSDSDSGSGDENVSRSDIEEGEKEQDVEDGHGTPPRPIPPRLSLDTLSSTSGSSNLFLDKRTPASGLHSKYTEPFDKVKLKAMFKANLKSKSRADKINQKEHYASSSRQTTSKRTTPKQAAPKTIPSRVSHHPLVSNFDIAHRDLQLAQQGAQRLTNTDSMQARSARMKSASSTGQNTQIDRDGAVPSRTAPNSTPRPGSAQSLWNGRIDLSNDSVTVSQPSSTKAGLHGVSSPARPRIFMQNTAGSGYVDSILGTTQFTGKAHNSNMKAAPNSSSSQRKRLETDGHVQNHSHGLQLGRPPINRTQASASTLKRKAEPINRSFDINTIPYKKRNRTVAQASSTLQLTAGTQADVETETPNDPKQRLKPAMAVPSPWRLKPNSPALNASSPLYKASQIPQVFDSEHQNQPPRSRNGLVTANMRAKSPIAKKTPVQTQPQPYLSRPDTISKTTVSVMNTGHTKPSIQPIELGNPTSYYPMESKSHQNRDRAYGGYGGNKTFTAESTSYTNVAQFKNNAVPSPLTAGAGGQSNDRKKRFQAAAKVPTGQAFAVKDKTKGDFNDMNPINSSTIARPVSLNNATGRDFVPRITLSNVAPVSADAEPYFEYSILTKTWPSSEDESSVAATELTSTTCTNIDETNANAERLFSNALKQYQQHFQTQFHECTIKQDQHGCHVILGTFALIEYPEKKTWIKVWVERHAVSALAGRAAKEIQHTSFVAKTIYVLRLFRLVPMAAASDSEAEEEASIGDITRVYHPLPHTECYTTLDAANRAAKDLQIRMSHKSTPVGAEMKWQEKSRQELNQKMTALRTAKDEERQYWKSEFNSLGLGSARFELIVEKAGLCGPRNL